MIFCATIVSFCLLGVASAQTIKADICLTMENTVQMVCTADSKITKCTVTSDNKVVASSDSQVQQDSTYKNRATVVLQDKICNMTLKGFVNDKAQTFNCTINDAKSGTAAVEKGKMLQCSACTMQNGVTLLLTLLAVHLMSKLM